MRGTKSFASIQISDSSSRLSVTTSLFRILVASHWYWLKPSSKCRETICKIYFSSTLRVKSVSPPLLVPTRWMVPLLIISSTQIPPLSMFHPNPGENLSANPLPSSPHSPPLPYISLSLNHSCDCVSNSTPCNVPYTSVHFDSAATSLPPPSLPLQLPSINPLPSSNLSQIYPSRAPPAPMYKTRGPVNWQVILHSRLLSWY